MILSPAWGALSINGRRAIERIFIELMRHGGQDNGALPVTYSDFEAAGIDPKYIADALVEVQTLGFVERTKRGTPKYGNHPGMPSLFRLTFKAVETAAPTDEWRVIQTVEEGKALVRAAKRAAKEERERERANNGPGGASPRLRAVKA